MTRFEIILLVMELIGSSAFAISGVMVAYENKMDIFGAIVLGCVTAVGGGVIRDLLLGLNPPSMFTDPSYVFVAFVVSLITFILKYRKHKIIDDHQEQTVRMLNITDTIGLAVFAVTGSRTAIAAGYGANPFLCIFVGAVTGIGGGILRDMMAGQMPLIMRERVYGVAAVAGSFVYILARAVMPGMWAIIISLTTTMVIRYLAIHYNWNLPRFH